MCFADGVFGTSACTGPEGDEEIGLIDEPAVALVVSGDVVAIAEDLDTGSTCHLGEEGVALGRSPACCLDVGCKREDEVHSLVECEELIRGDFVCAYRAACEPGGCRVARDE